MSAYRLQILDPEGEVAATWVPGSSSEVELIQTIADKVVEKGVGVFRTEAHVRADVVTAIAEVLYALKARVQPVS